MPPSQPPSPWRYVGLGLEFAGAVLILAYLGHLFDRWRGTEPWGLLIGLLAGAAGAMYNLIRLAMRVNR